MQDILGLSSAAGCGQLTPHAMRWPVVFRSVGVYVALTVVGLGVGVWQWEEHRRGLLKWSALPGAISILRQLFETCAPIQRLTNSPL